MKEMTGESTIYTVGGVKLDEPIKYKFTWSAYENKEELIAAKDELTLDEQVKSRNTDRLNNARTKAGQAELEARGIEKPSIENNPQLRLKTMVDVLLNAGLGLTREQATEVAKGNLNMQ